jgi:hypothetical protein
MEIMVIIGPILVIISTISILIGKGLVGLKYDQLKMQEDIADLKEKIPTEFVADWAVHKDRMDRILLVIDVNSSKKFINIDNPVPKHIGELFTKKQTQGIKRLTDWEIEQMIEAMNVIIADESVDIEERTDAKLQVAYLEGVKAERLTWRRIPRSFPAIKQSVKVPWWKVFI